MGLEARYDGVGLADDSAGRVRELLAGHCRAGPAIRTLEKIGAESMFESVSTAAQLRSPHTALDRLLTLALPRLMPSI